MGLSLFPAGLGLRSRSVSDSPCVVVKNPLSPVEHPGGVGVNCEMFEAGLDQFVVSNAICDLHSGPWYADSWLQTRDMS